MTKTVTHIEVPKGWISDSDYSSHRELLYLTLVNTDGDVLEVGCGYGSTRYLEAYCLLSGRKFTSYENDEGWAEKFKLYYGVQVVFKKGYPITSLPNNESVVFVDSKPGEERKDLIKAFADTANVIVTHDTEPGADYVYHMSEILSTFKYRLDYQPEGKPHTTAVSNIIDVTKWI